MTITRKFVEENRDKRFTIIFENGIVLRNIKFFYTITDQLCYLDKNRKRYGHLFPKYEEIKEIIEVKQKIRSDIDNAKLILKKIHPNAWSSLKEQMIGVINGEIVDDFNRHFKGKLKIKNISSLLSESQKIELKNAFENKSKFKWNRNTNHHSGRDLSISVEIDSDGELKAYFSSEYMGCGNGDYWLLLNPTTAVFYERD